MMYFPMPIVNKCCIALIILNCVIHSLKADSPQTRSITIVNKCTHKLDIYWVPGQGGEMVQQPNCPLVAGADMHLSSFNTHTFEVREMPSKKTGECTGEDKTCRLAYMTVNANQGQVFYIKPDLEIEHIDDEVRAMNEAAKIMSKCEEKARADMSTDSELSSDVTSRTIEELMACIEKATNDNADEAAEEIEYQSTLRDEMANMWEHYTCIDERRNTTESTSTNTWHHKGVGRDVKVLYEQHSFKVYLIPDFISEEECHTMEKEFESGEKKEDVKPVRREAAMRKADISRRIHALVKNYNLPVPAEENLQFIQTSEDGISNYSNLEPDSATIIMNCNVPEKGGALTFKEVGVHVNPEKGSAILFSIEGDDTKNDENLTTYRDCPVLSGMKKVVRQSM